jgi:exodeoxyribonuclease-3
VKIATWNVNSIAARLPLVERWLAEARPDILCLQETKCIDARFPTTFDDLGYSAVTFGQPTYNGVAILSRSPAAAVRRNFPDDEHTAQARLLTATVAGTRIVNVYVPNGAFVGSDKYAFKLNWMARLRSFLDAEYDPGTPVLLCGDFNVAPEDRDVHDPRLWEGKVLFSDPERTVLAAIMDWGFKDAFRLHTPETGHYSWWDYRAGAFRRNLGLRIDHIWVSPPLAARCTGSWIEKETRAWERPSDHAPVVAEFV